MKKKGSKKKASFKKTASKKTPRAKKGTSQARASKPVTVRGDAVRVLEKESTE